MSSPVQALSNELPDMDDPSEQLSVSAALARLEACREVSEIPSDTLVAQCLAATDEVPNKHKLYAEMGEIFVHFGMWLPAEQMAILALRTLPRFGAAFKLLGKALAGAGRPNEAALCHRFGLPQSMLQKYFSEVPVKWVSSQQPIAESIVKKEAFPAESYSLKPPKQVDNRVYTEFQNQELHAVEAYTTVIKEGRFWFDGFNGIVWDRYGNLVKDLCRGYAEVVQGSLGDVQPKRLQGRVCVLANRNANNFYHWMNDIVPRIEVLRASGETLESIDWFICNPVRTDFQREILSKFGINDDRICTNVDAEYFSADELLVPVYGSNTLGMGQGAWNPAFYKREYLKNVLPCEADLKLYVSRGSEGARGVINDAEIIDYLSDRGFTTVKAENLTVDEQARLFARASVVLGPHGAGFSNIVFCQPGTKVIELFNAHIVQCFYVISEVSELEHYIHFCGVHDDESRPDDNEKYHRTIDARRRSPFRVELPEIEEILTYAAAL